MQCNGIIRLGETDIPVVKVKTRRKRMKRAYES